MWRRGALAMVVGAALSFTAAAKDESITLQLNLPPPKEQPATETVEPLAPAPQDLLVPPADLRVMPEPAPAPKLETVSTMRMPQPKPQIKIEAPKLQPVTAIEAPNIEPAIKIDMSQLPPAIKPEPAKLQNAKPAAPNAVEMNPIDDMPGGKAKPMPGGPPVARCFVRDVMAFYDRTHVRCYNKTNDKVIFFAVDTSQPVASTVVTKALSAMQSGKPVTITYAPGTDLNPSNCARQNCRRLIDIKN